MLGNFSFGDNDYEHSVELWHSLLIELAIPVDNIHIHPTQENHKTLWQKRGYNIVPDEECVWSDGNIGGYCCEIYSRGLEIGNLVNTLVHSTDVGFGWERLHMIVEGKERIDQTSLFDTNCHPVVSDHRRTLEILWKNNIQPGSKGRNYICKKLIRRMSNYIENEKFIFDEWIQKEVELKNKNIERGKKMWRKHKDKSPQWWWETCGILEDELLVISG